MVRALVAIRGAGAAELLSSSCGGGWQRALSARLPFVGRSVVRVCVRVCVRTRQCFKCKTVGDAKKCGYCDRYFCEGCVDRCERCRGEFCSTCITSKCVRAYVHARVHACVRACACVHTCVRASARAY